MSPDFQLIRLLADYSARAYAGTTVNSARTGAAAIIEVINLPDASPAIIVAFRGSRSPLDFIHDAECYFASYVRNVEVGLVHSGFLGDFESLKAEVIQQVLALRKLYVTVKIYVTGHSLGGALAILAALELRAQQLTPALVVTFGQPRVGNAAFAQLYNAQLRENTWRVINQNDVVPRTPGWLFSYRHCGQEILLDEWGSYDVNPPLACKLFVDALGLWRAYSKREDVLIREHFIHAYQEMLEAE